MALNSRDCQPLDDPFYYLNNFRQVLDWLELRYADVMSEPSMASSATSRHCRALRRGCWCAWSCARACISPGKLITRDRRHRDAAQPLLEHGWLDDQALLSVAEVFDVLLKAELLQAFGQFIEQPKGARTTGCRRSPGIPAKRAASAIGRRRSATACSA
jgi:hypothetical protein